MLLSSPKLKSPTIFTTNPVNSCKSSVRTCMAGLFVLASAKDDKAILRAKEITVSTTNSAIESRTINLLTSQENPVGILGGVSAFATLVFLEKLVWWSSRGDAKCLPFIVSSGVACCERRPKAEMIEKLRTKRVFLEQSGARCIVMPCHVSSVWHKEVSYGCSVTFLSLRDSVIWELQEADLMPLQCCSKVRIGVLARDQQAPIAKFYVEKLQSLGYEAVVPDKPTMEHMLIPAIEALDKKDIKGARILLRLAIQVLLVMAVNKIILASTEFQDLLPYNDPLLKHCVHPMDTLARSTIQLAQSIQKDT